MQMKKFLEGAAVNVCGVIIAPAGDAGRVGAQRANAACRLKSGVCEEPVPKSPEAFKGQSAKIRVFDGNEAKRLLEWLNKITNSVEITFVLDQPTPEMRENYEKLKATGWTLKGGYKGKRQRARQRTKQRES
jgi:hypothetical protein